MLSLEFNFLSLKKRFGNLKFFNYIIINKNCYYKILK